MITLRNGLAKFMSLGWMARPTHGHQAMRNMYVPSRGVLQRSEGKMLNKPAKAAIRHFREKISDTLNRMKGAKGQLQSPCREQSDFQFVGQLAVVEATAMVSTETHQAHQSLDRLEILLQRARTELVIHGQDDNGLGQTLRSLFKIPIQRHSKIKGEANPVDPSVELYFEARNGQEWERDNGSYKLRTLYASPQ